MGNYKQQLNQVVDYWFEKPDDYQKWFFEGKKLDKYLKSTFSDLLIAAKNDSQITSLNLREKLGLIVLLDQFSRHIYRDSPDAFTSDPQSLQITKTLLETDEIDKLNPTQQLFALMPLQHSENIADKDTLLDFAKQKLKLSENNDNNENNTNTYKSLILHTNGHKLVLEKFGRYPKRNIALARKSTEKELIYLEQNPNSAY